jgi:hypothetical protein
MVENVFFFKKKIKKLVPSVVCRIDGRLKKIKRHQLVSFTSINETEASHKAKLSAGCPDPTHSITSDIFKAFNDKIFIPTPK